MHKCIERNGTFPLPDGLTLVQYEFMYYNQIRIPKSNYVFSASHYSTLSRIQCITVVTLALFQYTCTDCIPTIEQSLKNLRYLVIEEERNVMLN